MLPPCFMHPAHFSCHAHDHCRRGIDLLRSLSRDQRIDLKIGRVIQRQRLALQRRFGPLQVMPFHVPGNNRSIAAQTARNLRHAAPAEIQQPHCPSVPFGDVSSLRSSSHARSVTQVRMGRIHAIPVSSRKTRSLCPGPSICWGSRRLGPGYLLRKFRDDRGKKLALSSGPALSSSPARPRYIARGKGRRTGRSRRPSSRWRISRSHSRDR